MADGVFLYRGKTDFKGALAVYRSLLAAAPNNAELWYNAGLAERRAGTFEAAIAALEHAARLSPLDAGYAATLGQTYEYVGDWRKSTAEIARAKALAPGSGYVLALEMQHFWLAGDGDAFWRFYDEARAAPGADAMAIDTIFAAIALSLIDDPERLTLIEGRLAALGASDDALIQGLTVPRGEALLRLGRTEEARAIFEDALARVDKLELTAADERYRASIRMTANSFLGRGRETLAAAAALIEDGAGDRLSLSTVGSEIVRSLLFVGEKDRAFEILQQLVADYSISKFGLAVSDYAFDGVRGDPRYKALEAQYQDWRKRAGID